MPYTEEQLKEIQLKMYGTGWTECKEQLAAQAQFAGGYQVIVVSILSDAQEMMTTGTACGLEYARQYINRAKCLTMEHLTPKREG